MISEGSVSKHTFSRETGIQIYMIKKLISCGRISLDNKGRIPIEVYEIIIKQKSDYVPVSVFLKSYDNGLFESKLYKHRNKFKWFLAKNNYFGIRIYKPKEFLFCTGDENEYFFHKNDIPRLEEKCMCFFEDFGLSNEEKIIRLKNGAHDHPKTLKYLALFEKTLLRNKAPTPSYVAFVSAILKLPDADKIDFKDVIESIDRAENVSESCKSFMTVFLNLVSEKEGKNIIAIKKNTKDYSTTPAYTKKETAQITEILFNNNYATEHNLVKKAYEYGFYAEMWLFLCCHFTCGWRAGDICNAWNHAMDGVPRHYDVEGQCNSLLASEPDTKTLSEISSYCVSRIEKSNLIPRKTGKGKLRLEIHDSLKPFFGQLVVLVLHHRKSGTWGFFKAHRIATYENRVQCERFFGYEIREVLGNNNLLSRRLNKTFLQGIEEAAKEDGNSAFCAHQIANLARNHTNLDTTSVYLRDGRFSELDPGEVISMMFDEGIMGCMGYNLLASAFPDYVKLSTKQKSEVLGLLSDINPYQIELLAHTTFIRNRNKGLLFGGDTSLLGKMLLGVFNGKGMAKDSGVFCASLAIGHECENPSYKSCIANVCPYCIITKTCLEPMMEVIREYRWKAYYAGLPKSIAAKYVNVLNNEILPAFIPYLKEFQTMMDKNEKSEFKNKIGRFLLEDTRDGKISE